MKYIDAGRLIEALKAAKREPEDTDYVRGMIDGYLGAAAIAASMNGETVIKLSRASPRPPVQTGNEYYCPDCKAMVGRSYHYCWQCGQKLDWRKYNGNGG